MKLEKHMDQGGPVAAAKQLKKWSQQFQNRPDHELVSIRVGDLKMFTRLILEILDIAVRLNPTDGGDGGRTAAPLRVVR
jgi:hypothetical protein